MTQLDIIRKYLDQLNLRPDHGVLEAIFALLIDMENRLERLEKKANGDGNSHAADRTP